jgi:hypothetical protein
MTVRTRSLEGLLGLIWFLMLTSGAQGGTQP